VDDVPLCVAVALVTPGTGLRIVAAIVPGADAAELTAEIVTVLGDGTLAGAVYKPVAEITPVAAEPPAAPLTCQLTALLLAPETVAVNCAVLPTRTWLAPATTTIPGVSDGGSVGVVPPVDPVLPVDPVDPVAPVEPEELVDPVEPDVVPLEPTPAPAAQPPEINTQPRANITATRKFLEVVRFLLQMRSNAATVSPD
jgi:hypothetical protein